MFDFGVGYSELFVLGLIAILVIGPKDLPKVVRMIGQMTRKVRGIASEFQGHVNAAMRETGMEDLKKDIGKAKDDFEKAAAPLKGPGGVAVPTLNTPSVSAVDGDFVKMFGSSAQGETRVLGHIVEHADSMAGNTAA